MAAVARPPPQRPDQTCQSGFQVVQNVDIGHDGMMRNALQRPIAEMAGLAAADHRRRDFKLSKATQAGQRGDYRRHVADLIFAQVPGFRARIGDQLLAVAVIQLLRHRKRLVGRPAPTLVTGLLQGWEIEEAWRRLPLFFNRDAERPLMPCRGLCDRLGADALLYPHFGGRGMTHQEAPAGDPTYCLALPPFYPKLP